MKKSKLLNTSILDNTRVRIQPNLIVGESNGYKSGDILDANAVVELVKKYSGGSKDEDFADTKKASKNFFYREINGIKYVMYRTDDGSHEEFGYSGGGNYIITDDPYNFKMKYYAAADVDEAPDTSSNVLQFAGDRGTDDGYFSYVTVSVSSDYHDGTKEITLPVEGEYISDLDNPDEIPAHIFEITDDNVREVANAAKCIILKSTYNSASYVAGPVPQVIKDYIDNLKGSTLQKVLTPYIDVNGNLIQISRSGMRELIQKHNVPVWIQISRSEQHNVGYHLITTTTVEYIYDLAVSFNIVEKGNIDVTKIQTKDGMEFTGVGDYFINWVVSEHQQ